MIGDFPGGKPRTLVLWILMGAGLLPTPATAQRISYANDRSDRFAMSSAVEPDVIVAELYQISNYGVVGPTAALSIGTISCNVGNQSAVWDADTNQHPVIAQNMYRLKEGRFEQIGLSWLKHGFYAVNGSTCYTDCQGTNGTALGVHCSDPYSANLNGTQFNLGPRYQVDAFTGYFPYPPADPPYSGTLARRLQVAVVDLDQTLNQGADYFAEAHYVTPDDAAAGNQDNNVSYRPVIVSGAGSAVFAQLDGETYRRDPAIRAWKRADPAVIETNIRVPGEGLFILAAKATALSGGFWSYEYALYNMNSHRAAASFRVPVDPSSSLTNVAFHDVSYHSGEPFSGANWTVTASGVSLTWSAQTYSQNVNANALRWGSLYNFGFEADAPPQATVVRMGLFRPGNPDAVDAITIGPATNTEDCNQNEVSDSIDILNGTSEDCDGDNVPDECEAFAARAVRVAMGLNEPVFATAPGGEFSRLFIVERSGRIRILKEGVLLTTPFLDIGAAVSASADDGLMGLAFDPNYAANGRFYVNYVNTTGDLVLSRYTVSANPDLANPGSVLLLKSIPQDGPSRNGGSIQFGPDDMLYLGVGDGGAGPNDPQIRAQDSGSLLGKLLRLDVNAPPNYIPFDNPFVSPSLPLDEIWALGLGHPRSFSFDRLTGDLYLTDIGGLGRDEINFQSSTSPGGENYGWRCMEGSACTGLTGCTCNAPSLTPPVLSYLRSGNQCAVTGGYAYRGCLIPNFSGLYFHTDECSGTIRTFRLVNGQVTDPRDRTAELTPLEGPITSIRSFGQDAGGEFYIVSGDGDVYLIIPRDVPPDVCGNGVLEDGEACDDGNTTGGDGCDGTCNEEPGLVNDSCTDAISIMEGAHSFDTSDATTDGPSEPAACNFNGYTQVGSDIWFCYTASCSGTASIDLCGSGFDTKVAVYTGCECPLTASAIACNDNSCGQNAQVTVTAEACGSYLIRVGGRLGQRGSGTLNVTCQPSPVINDCNGNSTEDAADIACGTSTDGNSNGIPDECETDGDFIVGGRLYDGWWTELGLSPPPDDHPLWPYRPDAVSNPSTGSATWRCLECHGWDYQGVNGRYANGPHRTGFPGILGTQLSADDLFSMLKERPNNGGGAGILNGHDYGTVLPDTRIHDLVAFVLSGAIDDMQYIDAEGGFIGDPSVGQVHYKTGGAVSCITCHGADGTAINFGTFQQPEYLGTVAVQNSWEMLHKIRFGEPAAPMPSWLAGGQDTQGAADIGRYIQLSFPTECVDDAQCDDGVECTLNSCGVSGRCLYSPDNALCPQDGLFCNGQEVCAVNLGCGEGANPCAGTCNETIWCGCLPPVVETPGARYLTLWPQALDPSVPMRIQVTPVCAPKSPRWVGFPGPENVANLVAERVNAALLTAEQWGQYVSVKGLDIIPATTYLIQADCGSDMQAFLTDAATVTTQILGDVVGTYTPGNYTPPDGLANFIDIVAVVDGFRQISGVPPFSMIDLFGCLPDQQLNFLDIAGAVDGFRGRSYSDSSLCPVPCP